jgi:hypothetical protein
MLNFKRNYSTWQSYNKIEKKHPWWIIFSINEQFDIHSLKLKNVSLVFSRIILRISIKILTFARFTENAPQCK